MPNLILAACARYISSRAGVRNGKHHRRAGNAVKSEPSSSSAPPAVLPVKIKEGARVDEVAIDSDEEEDESYASEITICSDDSQASLFGFRNLDYDHVKEEELSDGSSGADDASEFAQ